MHCPAVMHVVARMHCSAVMHVVAKVTEVLQGHVFTVVRGRGQKEGAPERGG